MRYGRAGIAAIPFAARAGAPALVLWDLFLV
jgi:hypothetical protein